MRKPKGYWTKERCHEEALKYKSRKEFKIKSGGAYDAAKKNKWLNEICSHMVRKVSRKKRYWTKEKCHEEAFKCTTRNEFIKKAQGAYDAAIKNKWLDEICSHMVGKVYLKKGYWTKERCKEEALKYKHRGDFSIKSSGAYNAAIKNKWLDEICSHMSICGNRLLRHVYSFEFEDNSVYIGLSYNIKVRKKAHLKSEKSTVFKYIKNKCSKYKFKILTKELVTSEKASELEMYFAKKYLNEGWNVLNCFYQIGNLGGSNVYWTKERCKEEALKYKTRKEFQFKSRSAYVSALKNKLLDDICSHMELQKKPSLYWTKERCKEEALKYKTMKEFQLKKSGAYGAALRNKWKDDICSHMIKKSNWTKEKCHEEAFKCTTRNEFIKKGKGAYVAAKKKGWLDEICSHMVGKAYLKKGYWTKEKCHEEALKYKTRSEFYLKSNKSYTNARMNKWLDEICNHMKKYHKKIN